MSVLGSVFSFPNPVNEVAARMVAGMVFALSLAIILTGEPWLMAVLAYGFAARAGAAQAVRPVCGAGFLGHSPDVILRDGLRHCLPGRAGRSDGFRQPGSVRGVLRGMLRVQSPHALGPDPGVGLPGVRGGT